MHWFLGVDLLVWEVKDLGPPQSHGLFNILTDRILNFQLGTSCICGEVAKTMKIKLMGSLGLVPTCL